MDLQPIQPGIKLIGSFIFGWVPRHQPNAKVATQFVYVANSTYAKLSCCYPNLIKSSTADPEYYIRRNATGNVSEVLRRLRPASVTTYFTRTEMMSSFCLMLAAVLLAQISRACDGDNEEQLLTTQDPEVSYAQAYGYTPDTWNALDNQPASAGSPVDGKKKQ